MRLFISGSNSLQFTPSLQNCFSYNTKLFYNLCLLDWCRDRIRTIKAGIGSITFSRQFDVAAASEFKFSGNHIAGGI